MIIKAKRLYTPAEQDDGFRVLVDRMWPRGISKTARLWDLWFPETAPTADLKKWFHQHLDQWEEFKKQYTAQLEGNTASALKLLTLAGDRPLTLVYASRDTEHNQAVVLRDYLLRLVSERP